MRNRRSFLKLLFRGAAVVVGSMHGIAVPAKPSARGKLEVAIASAIGEKELKDAANGRIRLEVPDIAENGAIVPVTVGSALPDVREILLFVEKNPTPLAARLRFEAEMDAFASLRIKMNESCDLLAVVRSGDDFYSARAKVKVMVGGCS